MLLHVPILLFFMLVSANDASEISCLVFDSIAVHHNTVHCNALESALSHHCDEESKHFELTRTFNTSIILLHFCAAESIFEWSESLSDGEPYTWRIDVT